MCVANARNVTQKTEILLQMNAYGISCKPEQSCCIKLILCCSSCRVMRLEKPKDRFLCSTKMIVALSSNVKRTAFVVVKR